MTTIVADHAGMASDSMAADCSVKCTVKKFWRVRGWLIGGAGTYSCIVDVLEELRRHRTLSPHAVLRDIDFERPEGADLLLLSPTGKLYLSEGARTPYEVNDGYAAIGSGAQGALVAMHLGASPAEAVRTVKKVDPNTGGRVITRQL